jgi:hypothetical protein
MLAEVCCERRFVSSPILCQRTLCCMEFYDSRSFPPFPFLGLAGVAHAVCSVALVEAAAGWFAVERRLRTRPWLRRLHLSRDGWRFLCCAGEFCDHQLRQRHLLPRCQHLQLADDGDWEVADLERFIHAHSNTPRTGVIQVPKEGCRNGLEENRQNPPK